MSNSVQPYGPYPARLLCPWGLSRQEYWSGLPCPPPGDLPNPGIKPRSPALQADFLPFELRGSPKRGMHWLHWARNWIQAPAWQAGSYHWTTHAPCNVCTTLFTVARQKQHECPSTEGWIQKMRCICPVEYCSAIKKDELMPFAVTYFYRVDYICQDKDF